MIEIMVTVSNRLNLLLKFSGVDLNNLIKDETVVGIKVRVKLMYNPVNTIGEPHTNLTMVINPTKSNPAILVSVRAVPIIFLLIYNIIYQ